MDLYESARIVASFATAVGVGVAAWQIRRNAEQAKTSFEDSLAKEYRDLMRTVSYKALMGMAISDAEADSSKEGIYNYLDFCNQQVYLRSKRRVRKSTWGEWVEGMRINLSMPIFVEVSKEVFENSPDLFSELKRLQSQEFGSDPADW